jgi:hypothetical protein
MFNIRAAYFLPIILMLAFGYKAQAQTYTGSNTITAGNGTLSFNYSQTTYGCEEGGGRNGTYKLTIFNNFAYTEAGVTTTFNFAAADDMWGLTLHGGTCIQDPPDPAVLNIPNGVITFNPVNNSGNATASYYVQGFINPKYVIVGVTYAPPGPSSNVTYTNATSIGNTSTISSSFSNDLGFSVSVTNKASIPGGKVVNGFAGFTNTSSTDYTQGSNSSTTTTINKSTSVAYKTNGTGDAFSPVNSDYDTIWLWLNPELIITYIPATSTAGASIQWNGYAFDPNDPSGAGGPDIYPVQVGYLNGHFGSNPSVNAVLARSWATGQTWPSGEGPGLTSTDIGTIIANDPLASGYSLLASLPTTTSDGRFTQIPYPPNPIAYTQAGLGNGGGLTTTYNLVQTNTQSVASGASNQFKQAFGVEEDFGGSFLGLWGTSTTLKESDTLTWNYSWLNTLTTTTTLTNALSITGPGCPQPLAPCSPEYTGPGQFIGYQDNLYGTFVFVPAN